MPGHSPLGLIWKDASCSRYFIDTDSNGRVGEFQVSHLCMCGEIHWVFSPIREDWSHAWVCLGHLTLWPYSISLHIPQFSGGIMHLSPGVENADSKYLILMGNCSWPLFHLTFFVFNDASLSAKCSCFGFASWGGLCYWLISESGAHYSTSYKCGSVGKTRKIVMPIATFPPVLLAQLVSWSLKPYQWRAPDFLLYQQKYWTD